MRLEVVSRDFGMVPLESYGGVDVALYRVPRPLAFLKQQRNLHRVRVEGLPREEGLANTLAHLWDRWYKASRLAWRRVFSSAARKSVTREAPDLKTSVAISAPTEFRHPPQFEPLPGFELVSHFRYPVHRAAPIQPPKEVRLAGSSSEWVAPSPGNVMIPLGRLAPGLYLVEGYAGSFRATTLVFVSDTVAVTKVSGAEMVVWAAERTNGAAVPGVEVTWTDGTGVLESGRSDGDGIVRLSHATPERSYVFGADPRGGVFVAESFYYDSEIHDAKLYAVTDRPLYRPGDEVFVKVAGRDFETARRSVPLAPGDVALTVYDPNGVPVATQNLRLDPETGGDTSFRLPENATGGGYELRLAYREKTYAAAFRVAEYQKPHFEIVLVPDKPDFKTREDVSGLVQLRYPDGKPVRDAEVQLSVRSQQLSMVDGELGYYGQFPVKLRTETLRTDTKGEARFTLPAAEQPSRYVLTFLATDGAAYRVRTTRELLVERSPGAYTVRADRRFSAPREKVAFAIRPASTRSSPPASWDWVRLEDRQRASGSLASPDRLELAFADPGSYTVHLRDARGNVVGGTPHWVSGGSLRAPSGTIEIVPSRDKCVPGQPVDLLITFPEPVEEALLTLERDRVERTALLNRARGWVVATRIAPNQWRARLPVRADFAPNVTFSVAYVRNGEYVFQNQGLQVAQPRVEVALRPDKDRYAPGETVTVDVTTSVSGRTVPVTLAVSVVDEMVYALQPEIAPDPYDFFHHPRRNNVRTASSQSFIGYDLASSRSRGAPPQRSVAERRVKVLERPRREEKDTAFWEPKLRTDGSGRGRFRFVMPDSLTRWRITARAFAGDGTVGHTTAHLRSEKELYAKWTSPTWMRHGDAPVAAIAVFNQTDRDQAVALQVAGPGLERSERLALAPGVTFVSQPLAGLVGDGHVRVTIERESKAVDSLDTRFLRVPAVRRQARSLTIEVRGTRTPLPVPSDARGLRLTLASSSSAQLARVIDDLIEYPHGCVEQTASRMIPFALAVQSLGPEARGAADRLRQHLNGHRLRLAYLASPDATFLWWGASTQGDPLLTAYAYYADWTAVRALGVERPLDHWSRLLDVYARQGRGQPLVHRALMIGWMQEMGLPVKGLIQGLLVDMAGERFDAGAFRTRLSSHTSPILADPEGGLAHALALGVADAAARRDGVAAPDTLARPIEAAWAALGESGLPAAEALLLAAGRRPAGDAERVLSGVTAEMPTMERALSLVWIDRTLSGTRETEAASPSLREPWQRTVTVAGAVQWRWPAGEPPPAELRFEEAPAHPTAAIARFESAAGESALLPVGVQRRFYRVTKGGEGHELELMAEGVPLSTNELYLDELTLLPRGRPIRYALVEVPLPPGASVESTTWGIRLRNESRELVGLERARHEPTPLGYVVPVDPVAKPMVVRHLVRFSQKGVFGLPPARLYRMYQPDAEALENGAVTRRLAVR